MDDDEGFDPGEPPPWLPWLAFGLALLVCAYFMAPLIAELIGARR